MTGENKGTPRSSTGDEKIPRGQRFLDNIYLLLALGVGLPFLLYTLWGILEMFQVPHH
ncbi:MAG: hypothetical protein HYX79_02685 [Chloroflexi bacterium]|nr:hypothetical protein [Chloroflexota bacterium]